MKTRIKVTASNTPESTTWVNVDHITAIVSVNDQTWVNVMDQRNSLQVDETLDEVFALIDAA